MAFTTGNAANHNDLLVKLKDWARGTLNWQILRYTPGERTEVWLQGPGAGADQPVIVGALTDSDVTNGYYCWELAGTPEYSANATFSTMPQRSPSAFFNIWQNEIPYWFYGNSRRLVVIAKCGTSYVSAYLGFFLPFALPDEHPFPLYIAGNYGKIATANINNAANNMITNPGTGSAWFRPRNVGTWVKVENQAYASNDSYEPINRPDCFLWPMRAVGYISFGGESEDSWTFTALKNLRPNSQNELPLYQCQIIHVTDAATVGALDGVFATGGFNRVSEQAVTSGNRNFRLFQNIFRTTSKDFFAVEEI